MVALHTRTWNPGGRARALLLHGLGSDGATLWRLADHLAGHGYSVVAPDLRGQGLSPPTGSYAVGDIAADVRALGSGWDLLVGHSLGGATACVLLADAGFARAAVLLDPVVVVDEADKPALLEMLLAEVGGALTVPGVRAAHPHWDDEDVFRLVRASESVSPHVVRRVLHDTTPWDFAGLAGAWSAGVTVLAADPARGALFPPAHAERLRAACPTARVVTVPQAGHSVHRDAPGTVLAALDHAVAGAPISAPPHGAAGS